MIPATPFPTHPATLRKTHQLKVQGSETGRGSLLRLGRHHSCSFGRWAIDGPRTEFWVTQLQMINVLIFCKHQRVDQGTWGHLKWPNENHESQPQSRVRKLWWLTVDNHAFPLGIAMYGHTMVFFNPPSAETPFNVIDLWTHWIETKKYDPEVSTSSRAGPSLRFICGGNCRTPTRCLDWLQHVQH